MAVVGRARAAVNGAYCAVAVAGKDAVLSLRAQARMCACARVDVHTLVRTQAPSRPFGDAEACTSTGNGAQALLDTLQPPQALLL